MISLIVFVLMHVTWDAQADANSFEVSVKRGRKKEIIYQVPTNSMSLDVKLSETTRIKVRALNTHGKSAWSKQLHINKSHICVEHGR